MGTNAVYVTLDQLSYILLRDSLLAAIEWSKVWVLDPGLSKYLLAEQPWAFNFLRQIFVCYKMETILTLWDHDDNYMNYRKGFAYS